MSRIFKINIIVLILSIFISCSAQKELYTHKLPQENECIYLVDTIDFKDPIIIEYNGIRYIMESTIVKNNNNKPFDKIIKENMVSILSTDLGIYYDLPVSLYPKISELLGIDYFPKFYEENNIKLLKEDNKHLIEEKDKLCSQIETLKLKIKERDTRFTQFKKDIEDVNVLLNDIIINKHLMNGMGCSTFEQVQLIKKTFFDYYNILLSNKNEEINEMMLTMVNVHSVSKGKLNVFIPLTKHNYNNKWYTLTMNKDINDNEYIITNINSNVCCMILGEVITVSHIKDKQYEVYLNNIIYFPIKCLNG
jgi:hypothetical protein